MRLSELYPKEYVDEQLKKAGEGSRGGRVIGHTSSGKPIYDRFNHPAHKYFTEQDHVEASNLHADIDRNIRTVKYDDKGKMIPTDWKKSDHHNKQFNAHAKAGGDTFYYYHKDVLDKRSKSTKDLLKKFEGDKHESHSSNPEQGGQIGDYDDARRRADSLKLLSKNNERYKSKAISLDDYSGDHIQKSFVPLELQKGEGEGSRGGNVIGHYPNGKPIYGHHIYGQKESPVVHAESKEHGDYHVENHGADVHTLYFKTPRKKKPEVIGTFKGLDNAKKGIENHTNTGWSKPGILGNVKNPDATWLKDKPKLSPISSEERAQNEARGKSYSTEGKTNKELVDEHANKDKR